MSSASSVGSAAPEPAALTPFPGRKTAPGNLPFPLTPFIGRNRERAAVVSLLRAKHVRLLTLTGPGGVGKTRLALQVAVELHDEYDDGVWFVALAAISDLAFVAPTIARTLGIPDAGDWPLSERLKTYLRERQALLVLDNFEQLLPAAPLLTDLLSGCPALKILVTSRAILRLSGEHDFSVPPLALPDAARAGQVERVAAADAVQLFLTRASASRPDFALSADNAGHVSEICRRLDGLPLAIELAAARIAHLPVADVLARLERRLPLLTGGARDQPARLQTMRNAIAWSYELLGAEEQRLFRRLSVFTGGCTLETVEELCQATGDRDVDVLNGLSSLVDTSLLRQDERADTGPRFVQLETIREYGLERLADNGEEAATRDAHAAISLSLAEEAEPHLQRREQLEWFARLEAERDNLRAALRWLRECGDAERALRLGGALWFFWWARGNYAEGWSQYDALFAMPGASARTSARAKALNGAGAIALWQGNAERSWVLHEEAQALARELGDTANAALSLLCLSATHIVGRSDYQKAGEAAAEGLALYRELGDPWGIASTLTNLALAMNARGNSEQAEALFTEALEIERELGDRWSLNIQLGNAGMRAADRGDLNQAGTLFDESLRLAMEVGDKRGSVHALWNLARLALAWDDLPRAIKLVDEALAIAKEIGDKPALASAMEALSVVLDKQGDRSAAIAAMRRALILNREVGDLFEVTKCIGEIAVMVGEPRLVARLLGAAAKLRDGISAPLSPTELAELDRKIDPARRALGSAGFADAWDAGRELSLDEAVAEALATDIVPSARKGESTTTFRLSPRELAVLRLVAEGKTDREIAEVLSIGRRTVEWHVTNILNKLGLDSRTAAATYAVRHGLA